MTTGGIPGIDQGVLSIDTRQHSFNIRVAWMDVEGHQIPAGYQVNFVSKRYRVDNDGDLDFNGVVIVGICRREDDLVKGCSAIGQRGTIVPSFQAKLPGTEATPPLSVLSASDWPSVMGEAVGFVMMVGVALEIISVPEAVPS